jgi:toxin ParE1/3/4
LSFYLTRKAKADLQSISRYTVTKWGISQRNNYLTQIDRSFHDLSEASDLGRPCDYIRKGYRKYQVGKHLIFYRNVGSDEIEIVRVLHERMDVTAYLGGFRERE